MFQALEESGLEMVKKILIADHVEINRIELKNILGDNYEYVEAVNGAAAMRVLREQHDSISLVLLELQLPMVDGYSVLEWISNQPWCDQIPVLVMADREGDLSLVDPSYQLGAVDNIMRPFSPINVRNRIHTFVRLYDLLAKAGVYK